VRKWTWSLLFTLLICVLAAADIPFSSPDPPADEQKARGYLLTRENLMSTFPSLESAHGNVYFGHSSRRKDQPETWSYRFGPNRGRASSTSPLISCRVSVFADEAAARQAFTEVLQQPRVRNADQQWTPIALGLVPKHLSEWQAARLGEAVRAAMRKGTIVYVFDSYPLDFQPARLSELLSSWSKRPGPNP
jgi:hypothetical protein